MVRVGNFRESWIFISLKHIFLIVVFKRVFRVGVIGVTFQQSLEGDKAVAL